MFIFNNVKSNLGIRLFLPNEVAFRVKVLLLYCLYQYRKPRRAEGGQTYIMVKGVFVRFGFDV